ncbi:unnamed protein product [Allacma fusca]|uniref:Uncharacterized protein n=2 Tax=Allacma fusca TaxID=39272 RepID=A0A8J2JYQ8_9HEXA|nr:unnamed protein product [Allacma fusca]
MSVENHTLEIIASDGFDVKPTTVDSVVVYAGERWDIIIRGSQPIGSYWIKFRGLMDCDDRFTSAYQVAVLNYDGIEPGTYPEHSIKSWKESAAPENGLHLNPLNIAPGTAKKYMTAAELTSLKDDDPEIIQKEKADHQFYLAYDFNPIDNIRFHGPHIPIRTVRKGFKLYTPQLNFISHVMPLSPPMTQPESIHEIRKCNESSMKVNCTVDYCECTHWLNVKLNSIVEIILVDRGYTFDANHPFHLHGHAFRVVGMERLGKSTEPWIIQERDAKQSVLRKRVNAPIKDTVTVPDGGYTILRFRADNPGYWFFHCHITFHVEVGMGLIIQVGEPEQMLKSPEHFPKCGNYIPPARINPIQVSENVQTIIPYNNISTPRQPPYSILSSTTMTTYDNTVDVDGDLKNATIIPLKESARPSRAHGRSSTCAISSSSNFIAMILLVVYIAL